MNLLGLVAAFGSLTIPFAAAATETEARRELYQQQLQSTLDLELQQSAPQTRGDLSPSDRFRLEQLQLRQRLELQQLEQHQLQRDGLRRNRDDRSVRLEQRLYAQERQLQIGRFEMEQRELLRSMKSLPLQRPPPNGRLQP